MRWRVSDTHFKYPRQAIFVDELPKGATGKILKRAIDPGRARKRRLAKSSIPIDTPPR